MTRKRSMRVYLAGLLAAALVIAGCSDEPETPSAEELRQRVSEWMAEDTFRAEDAVEPYTVSVYGPGGQPLTVEAGPPPGPREEVLPVPSTLTETELYVQAEGLGAEGANWIRVDPKELLDLADGSDELSREVFAGLLAPVIWMSTARTTDLVRMFDLAEFEEAPTALEGEDTWMVKGSLPWRSLFGEDLAALLEVLRERAPSDIPLDDIPAVFDWTVRVVVEVAPSGQPTFSEVTVDASEAEGAAGENPPTLLEEPTTLERTDASPTLPDESSSFAASLEEQLPQE